MYSATNNSIYLSSTDRLPVCHTPSMHCYGCDKKCHFDNSALHEIKERTGLEYYIWPDNNSFLVEGIRHHFTDVNDKYITQPEVIIDFSHKNINYFLSDNWLDQFKNMRLTLVTNKKMTAIAHYWFYNDTAEEVATKLQKTVIP